MQSTYDAGHIQVLEGLEAVRMRPGMYIGTTSTRGLHHLLWEIVDNAVDEASNVYASQVDVTLHQDSSASVYDNGRGVPVDIHPTLGIPGVEVIYTAVSEALTTQFRVSFVLAVILASPYIIFCIWRFIKPALYDNEIRMTRMLFVLALFLFLLGIVFCYRYVYNLAIDFFLVAGEDLATPMLSIDKYVNFLFSFLLPFGIVFELPVALYIAARMGVVNYSQLAKFRKYVFFAIFIMAAILTPPDVISQVMLGVPMYVLYEIGVQVVRFTKPKPRGEKEDRAIEE